MPKESFQELCKKEIEVSASSPDQGSNNVKHNQEYPTARKIKRSCNRVMFRTRKKLGQWIAPELVEQADELYYKKVLLNLPWIVTNGTNRRLLCDW